MVLTIAFTALMLNAGASTTEKADPGWPQPSVAQFAEWDRLTRKEADTMGEASIRESGPAMPKGVRNIDARRDPWVRLTEQETIRRNRQYPDDHYANKSSYSLKASVDYDRDGHIDLAEMVENSSQGGIRVTYGGPKARPPAIIFKDTHWHNQEILASGRHRIYLNKPELGFTLFFREKGTDRAYYLGD